MVMLYVAGKPVGPLTERLLVELAAKNQRVEFKDEAGNEIGTFKPAPARDPNEPLVPWDPTITREELDRRAAEPGLTFEEVKKRLGWE